jgi:hypothetical protein
VSLFGNLCVDFYVIYFGTNPSPVGVNVQDIDLREQAVDIIAGLRNSDVMTDDKIYLR